MATPTYTLIDSTTLTSSASSVTFSSITQDYRDLVLVVEWAGVSNGVVARVRINNDSGTNYSYVNAYGTGSGTSSFSATYSSIRTDIAGLDTSNKAQFKIDFMDYSATDKHKTLLLRSNHTSGSRVGMVCQRWANTSAITRLDIYEEFGTNLAAGSTFYLLGIEA